MRTEFFHGRMMVIYSSGCCKSGSFLFLKSKLSVFWDLILACSWQGGLTQQLLQALIYEWKRTVQIQVFLRKNKSFLIKASASQLKWSEGRWLLCLQTAAVVPSIFFFLTVTISKKDGSTTFTAWLRGSKEKRFMLNSAVSCCWCQPAAGKKEGIGATVISLVLPERNLIHVPKSACL